MNSNRTALIGMLIAAEILIAGLAIWSIGGAGHLAASGFSAQHVDYAGKSVGTFDAGTAPHVTVSDPESRVIVAISADGRVHVKDLTSIHGFFSSDEKVPPLRASRTADGVAVERDAYESGIHFMVGWSQQRIEVDVPADTKLDINKSSAADVTGIRGGTMIRSQDGHITLSDVQGAVDARTADGSMTASNVHGDTIVLQTADGHITISDLSANNLTARSEDGRVEASNLKISGPSPAATLHSDDGSVHVMGGTFASGGTYEISSNDGRVEVALAPGSDLTVQATTADGSIVVDGKSSSGEDSKSQTIKLGSGAGTMRLSSGDGSVHLTTNGAL